MKKLLFLVALAACGSDNDHKPAPDGSMPPMPDGSGPGSDGSMPMTTFTSYVIDLVVNQTSNTTEARPYSEFQNLIDADTANSSAYSSLF